MFTVIRPLRVPLNLRLGKYRWWVLKVPHFMYLSQTGHFMLHLLAAVQVVPHIEDRLLDVNLKGRVGVRVYVEQSVLVETHVSQRTDMRSGHLVQFCFRHVVVEHDADQLVLGSGYW